MARNAIRTLANGWGLDAGRARNEYILQRSVQSSSVTKVELDQPARPGDIVIIMGNLTAAQAPSGFTNIAAAGSYSANYKVMAGGEDEFTLSSSASGSYVCYHLRNCEAIFTQDAASATSTTFNSVNVPRQNDPALYFFTGNTAASTPYAAVINAVPVHYVNTGNFHTTEPFVPSSSGVMAYIRTGSTGTVAALGISVKVKL